MHAINTRIRGYGQIGKFDANGEEINRNDERATLNTKVKLKALPLHRFAFRLHPFFSFLRCL
jgi:hypothetical protein